MSPMKYDPESNTFVETEGWRSWGCTMVLVEYLATLVYIGWYFIVSAITLAVVGIPIALIVIAVLAMFGLI